MRELPGVNLKDLSGAVFGAFESARRFSFGLKFWCQFVLIKQPDLLSERLLVSVSINSFPTVEILQNLKMLNFESL